MGLLLQKDLEKFRKIILNFQFSLWKLVKTWNIYDYFCNIFFKFYFILKQNTKTERNRSWKFMDFPHVSIVSNKHFHDFQCFISFPWQFKKDESLIIQHECVWCRKLFAVFQLFKGKISMFSFCNLIINAFFPEKSTLNGENSSNKFCAYVGEA